MKGMVLTHSFSGKYLLDGMYNPRFAAL